MKILVCIIGQLRYNSLTWSKFKENVIDHLNADLLYCGPDEHPYAKYNIKSVAIISNKNINADAIVQHRRNLYKNLPEGYDQYILTRSDHLWYGPHPILDDTHTWFMNCEFHFGISDRHWVIPSSKMKEYCIIDDFDHVKFRNIEHYLWNIVKWGPDTSLTYFPMFLCDENGNPRRLDELESPRDTFMWPFKINHMHLSKNGMFCGAII